MPYLVNSPSGTCQDRLEPFMQRKGPILPHCLDSPATYKTLLKISDNVDIDDQGIFGQKILEQPTNAVFKDRFCRTAETICQNRLFHAHG